MSIKPIGAPVYNIPPSTIINILPPEIVNIIFGGSDVDVQTLSTNSVTLTGNGTPATPLEARLRVAANGAYADNKIVIIPVVAGVGGVYVAPANWSEITGNPESNTDLVQLLQDYNDILSLQIAELAEQVGDIDSLNTFNKTSTVGAINEVNAKIESVVGDNIVITLFKSAGWFTLY